ncbi:MAG: asparaginase, partial [Alphaproteobacteria bacterium]|nr:asparaginase [Alphaproteobacteria bacterium]
EAPVYPRSAIKPLQAIPLVETGAADAFGLDDVEIALACASHDGEPDHVDRVRAWLDRIGVGEAALECGSHLPYHAATAEAMLRAGTAPTPACNNCSGKHAGFLTTAVHRGEPIADYIAPTHPVQQRVLGVLEAMCVQDLTAAPRGRDGCSIPTWAIPLGGLAVGMARMADPVELPDSRAEAVMRIRQAWGDQPFHVAGSERCDTAILRATGGRVLVKTGAEGVYCACLPDLGLGLALKIEDGAGRAAQRALIALLDHLGALDGADAGILAPWREPVLTNRRGFEIGAVRAAAGFPG